MNGRSQKTAASVSFPNLQGSTVLDCRSILLNVFLIDYKKKKYCCQTSFFLVDGENKEKKYHDYLHNKKITYRKKYSYRRFGEIRKLIIIMFSNKSDCINNNSNRCPYQLLITHDSWKLQSPISFVFKRHGFRSKKTKRNYPILIQKSGCNVYEHNIKCTRMFRVSCVQKKITKCLKKPIII